MMLLPFMAKPQHVGVEPIRLAPSGRLEPIRLKAICLDPLSREPVAARHPVSGELEPSAALAGVFFVKSRFAVAVLASFS